MGLQFILGKESADKKQAIYERISGIMTEEPDAEVFVLVPEHAKLRRRCRFWKSFGNSRISAGRI